MHDDVLYIFPDGQGDVGNEAKLLLEYCWMRVYDAFGLFFKNIDAMMKEPQLKNIKIWRLATTDAHFLYEKFGFKLLAHPEKLMEKVL